MTQVPDFDALYRADPDPWRVRSSFYERRKLEIVLSCLSCATYDVAWDPACGVGELALRLADRATQVLATDASAEAVARTREQLAGRDTSRGAEIRVEVSALPAPPPGDFPAPDLVVLSEFVYYLHAADRFASLAMIDAQAASAAELMTLHWRHRPDDGYLSGAAMQAEIGHHVGRSGWTPLVHHEDRDFVLDSYRREVG